MDKFKGSLLGLAVGDAVGTTLEFQYPGSFKPIDDMVGGGPFDLEAGQWTDDTSMALCLADSIIKKGFDPVDQLTRYTWWYNDGYMSSTGECFDIGGTTVNGLRTFALTGNPYSGSVSPNFAGNGCIMRLAPVVLAYHDTLELLENAANSSRTTHGSDVCVDSCKALALIINAALDTNNKDKVLSPDLFDGVFLHPKVFDVVVGCSYKTKNPPDINGDGYVISTLEAALWAFYHSTNFKDGCLSVVNLGQDADTTGAVYGQIAGAFYGESGIPIEWLNRLYQKEMISDYAKELHRINWILLNAVVE
jgi:ADP-ribosylglycohydrolase